MVVLSDFDTILKSCYTNDCTNLEDLKTDF